MAAMPVLKPLHDAAGLRDRRSRPTRPCRGAGRAASRSSTPSSSATYEYRHPRRSTFDGAAVPLTRASSFPRTIAFNVIPLAGTIVDDGSLETDEEQKLRNESRKILEIPDLLVDGTCVRVPVFTGHSLSINASSTAASSPEGHRPARAAPGSWSPTCPTPARPPGRTRPSSGASARPATAANGLSLFVSDDNLRKGAALNAVQIAEALLTLG